VRLQPYEVLEAARVQADISVERLWVAYFGLGGAATRAVMRSYLDGSGTGVLDYDVLAQAINETYIERGGNHPVPYGEDLR
jgi:hypothetical protein